MAKPRRTPKRKLTELEKARAEIERLRQTVCELMHLIGCTIEALEFYDTDDGHAELILKGVAAEYTRITENVDFRRAFAE